MTWQSCRAGCWLFYRPCSNTYSSSRRKAVHQPVQFPRTQRSKRRKKSIVASQRKAIIGRGVGPGDCVSQQGKNTSNITPAGAIPKNSTPSRKTQLNPDQYHRPDRSRTNIAKLIKLIYTRGSSMSSMTRKVTRRPSKEREKMSKHQKRSRTTRERKEEKKPGA